LAFQAGGQQNARNGQNQLYKFSTRTNLVLVPVVVTDNHGRHVSGLTRDQFVLSEDGKEQDILHFEEVSPETSPARPAAASATSFTNQIIAPRPKKLEIIVLDLLNTPLAGRVEARRGLMRFLAKSANPDALLALFILRSDGAHLIHNFTSDPAILIAAIGRLQAAAASRDAPTLNTYGGDVDAEARQMEAILAGAAATAHMGSNPSSAAATARAQARGMEALADASRQNQEALCTLESLQQIAQYFAAVPGRKSLLWASTGFGFNLGEITGTASRGTTTADWQRTLRMLQESNIAIYPVDVGGLSASRTDIEVHGTIAAGNSPATLDTASTGSLTDVVSGKHRTMEVLAQATGGVAYYNFNDSDELFRRASDDFSEYYMLAYNAKDSGKYGWRKLNVKVRRDGVKVRARSGFFFDDPRKQSDPATAYKDLKIAMTSDLSFTAIPLQGEWLRTEPLANARKVHFRISIPAGVPAIDVEHENHLSLDFLVVASNQEGKDVTISQRLDTKLNQDGINQIENKGLDYTNSLTLVPGDYTVHFVVRDNLRGIMGSVVAPLKVD
jgi:VWFA-related protein